MKTNHLIVTISAFIGLAALAVGVSAQTDDAKTDTLRTRANAKVCAANGIEKPGCTQEEVDAAVAAAAAEAPARLLPGGTIYATRPAFRDAVIVKRALAEEDAKQMNEAASALTRAFVSGDASAADRVFACQILKVADPEICRLNKVTIR